MKRNKKVWLVVLAILAVYGLLCATKNLAEWFRKTVILRPAEEYETEVVRSESWIRTGAPSLSEVLPEVCSEDENEEERHTILTWSEEDTPLPEWWDPDAADVVWINPEFAGDTNVADKNVGNIESDLFGEDNKMVVEDDHFTDSGNMVAHPPEGIDPGGIDWNICTELVGWNGHRMEIWEMDMFARIAYLEFRSCGQECREAGVDAILRLWESEYYSKTISGTLSAKTESGAWAYSTYPGMWEESYDPDLLAEMKEICENRFFNGPVWTAPFFRLDYFHDWAKPCYQIENVCFSTGWGWD